MNRNRPNQDLLCGVAIITASGKTLDVDWFL
jgi:hypothetical protein